MERRVIKSCMNNLELQSLHYWFKNAPSQNPSYEQDDILKIMQDTIYKADISDILDTNTRQTANFVQNSRINSHQRVILRNVFEHWKTYVVHKLHTRRDVYKANYFYHKRLQKNVLNAFSRNVLLKWERIVLSTNKCTNKSVISESYKKAEQFYYKALLTRYFKYWCNYISTIIKKRERAENVVVFHNLRCLKKCITNWKMYVTLQRKQEIMQKFDEIEKLYAKNILRKFLRAWIAISEVILQRDKIKHAILHYESKLLGKYFSFWRIYHRYKQRKLNTAERIAEHRKTRLLRKYFRQFIVFVNESIVERVANENAEALYNSKLTLRVFRAWQEWYDKKVENATKIHEIRTVLQDKQKYRILMNWRLYIIQRKCRKRKTFKARHFYERRLASKVLKTFHNYALYRNRKRNELSGVMNRSEEITKQLQISYMDKWRRALYHVMQEKQKLNQAIKCSELNVTRKYFGIWQEFCRQYKTKMVHKRKLNDMAADYLLKKFILHWHKKLQGVLVIRKKESLIVSMIEQKMKKKVFLNWKNYIASKIKMNNEINTAIELHKKFVLREGLKEILRKFLRNIDYRRDMQLSIAAARSFENIEILKEYFDKWHSLICVKNKSERFSSIVNSNARQIEEISSNDFQTCLVLPEYMREKTMSIPCNAFTTFPENWSFNLFQPF